MLRFLYQASRSNGARVTGEMDADSAQAAFSQIEALGLSEIEILDLEDTARQRFQRARNEPEALAALRCEIEVKTRRRFSPVELMLAQLKAVRWVLLSGILLIALGLGLDALWLVGLAVFFLVLTIAYLVYKQIPVYLYQQILRADAYGDRRVLQSACARLRKRQDAQAAWFDIDVRLARAAVGDSSPEAMEASLGHWRDSVDPSQFEGRIATIYFAAEAYEQALAKMKVALELGKGEASKRLDYALFLARVGDVTLARQQADQVTLAALPTYASAYLSWVYGLIALRNNEAQEAAHHLTLANSYFIEHAENVVVWTSLAVCTGSLAVAMSRIDHKPEAIALLKPILPIFEASADKDLRRLVQQEVLN